MSDVVAERRQQVFPKLNDTQLQRIARYGEQRHAPAGEILFDQGTSALGIHVVLSGAVEIVQASSGTSSSPSSAPESSPAR
jgi:thioredoxin reductase (NADPH)